MVDVPDTPEKFFAEYVPARFESLKEGVAGKSSVGSLVFRVEGRGEWSLRLEDGDLRIREGVAEDVLVQVTLTADDFGPIILQGARRQEGADLSTDQRVLAFKALSIDEQLADAIRKIQGTVAFVVTDMGKTHRLLVTPAAAPPNLDSPECVLECQMSDFVDMQTGAQPPMQMAMQGKIKMSGNVQIAMALSAVFA